MPRILKLRKRSFETVVVMICLLLPAMTMAFRVESVQALNAGVDDMFDEGRDWWKYGHNWVILNAIELLEKDGYTDEVRILRKYLPDLIMGARAADYGTAGEYGFDRYWSMGQKQSFDNVIGMQDMQIIGGGTGGGISHFYDPWTHIGVGPAEDPGTCAFVAGLIPVAGQLADADLLRIGAWANWFGRNAGEAAVRAFDNACASWDAEYQEKAMFYLGMLLHVLTDVAAVPHHAANLLLSGHAGSEDTVDAQIIECLGTYVDSPLEDALKADTLANINRSSDSLDHVICLESLKERSDGIYIAGDPVLADDDGNIYGHIYQLPNPVEQFIDFAAHESLEWYPYFGEGAEGDLDSWWECPNYIEAGHGNLHMRSSSQPLDSRLIFHLEGVDSITADFEWADHNDEAIDMENFWGTDLGFVEAYSGYDYKPGEKRIGGPWVCDWWNGPEPSTTPYSVVGPGHETLQIRTVVNHGLDGDYSDDDCDGWQISEMRFVGGPGPWGGYVEDPLYVQKYSGEKYVRTDGTEGYISRLVWDDPIPGMNYPRTIAIYHLLDLAYKLCGGMVREFFKKVGLPAVFFPVTNLQSLGGNSYVDESNGMFATVNYFDLIARAGRMVPDPSDPNGKIIFQGEHGTTLESLHYKIDDQPWQYVGIWSQPQKECCVFEYRQTIYIPADGQPHNVTYYSTSHSSYLYCPYAAGPWPPPYGSQWLDEWPHKETTVFVDTQIPNMTITVGKPSEPINVTIGPSPSVLCITRDTPITLSASDGRGSGVKETYFRIFDYGNNGYVEVTEKGTVPGGEVWIHEGEVIYEKPFTLGGKEVQRLLMPITSVDTIEEAQSQSSNFRTVFPMAEVPSYCLTFPEGLTKMQYVTSFTDGHFASLPSGYYRIEYRSVDNLQNGFADLPVNTLEVCLLDHVGDVDLEIDPHQQNIKPGYPSAFTISVTNWCPRSRKCDLTLEGLNPTWFTLSETSTTIEAGQTHKITLTVSPPYSSLILKNYPFNVTVVSTEYQPHVYIPTYSDTEQGVLQVFPELPPESKVKLSGHIKLTAPTVIPLKEGAETGFRFTAETSFQIENLDISLDKLERSGNCIRLEIANDDISPWSNWTRLDLFIPAGQTANIPLTIKIPIKTYPHKDFIGLSFYVNATSLTGFPHAVDTARVLLTKDTDIIKDGNVNIADVAIVAKAFGTKPGDLRWNVLADLDGNSAVNIVDLAIIAKTFGWRSV